MKIAVVGAGAVGSYFGATLQRAGHDVHLLVRSQRVAGLGERGLRVRSRDEPDFTAVPTQVASDPADVGECDAVVVAVKAFQVADVAPTLRPLLGANTPVLPLQNGVSAPRPSEPSACSAGCAWCSPDSWSWGMWSTVADAPS